jgi:TRAP-type C4-dicarboxylate transport system substrate-binding protein
VVTLGLALAGCHGGPAAKAGAQTVTLRFATVDAGIDVNGQMAALTDFVAQVASRSHGQLQLQIVTDAESAASRREVALLKAIKRGTYDGGWNATRAFAPAGFRGLEALEAPFVLQSYRAERQVVTGPVGRAMLARLDGTGLTGLGLVTGPLRRPFAATRPLTKPADWRGLHFQVYDSPMQNSTTTALGARPVFVRSAAQDLPPDLGGKEFDIAQWDVNGDSQVQRYVTANVALWPKTYAIVMNTRRLAALTPQQRHWLREAAQQASQEHGNDFDDTPAALRMCLTGVRFAYVSAGQLGQLRAAVAPVYAMMQHDPRVAHDLAAMRAIAAADLAPSAPQVPIACRGLAPPTAAVDSHLSSRPAIPDGTYRVRVVAHDFERLGAEPSHAQDNAALATLTLQRGIFVFRVIFDGSQKPELVEAGPLRGTATTVIFIPDRSVMNRIGGACTNCSPLEPPYSYRYTYAHGRLTLSGGQGVTDPISLGTFASHPWLRIG